MDLRPKMARDAAESILRDVEARIDNDYYDENNEEGQVKAREIVLERYTGIILNHIKSRSIRFPQGDGSVSTYDPHTVVKFLAKYPRLQQAVDCAKAEASRRWPNATFKVSVFSNPEACHICHEAQRLTLHITLDHPWSRDVGSPCQVARQEWMDWICDSDTAMRAIEETLGEERHLFRATLEETE